MTLIEVLVVILIVGLLAGIVALNVDINSPRQALEREAQRLQLLLTAAAEQALLEGAEYGLWLAETEYQVLAFDERERQWRQSEAPMFQLHRLPESVNLALEMEDRVVTLGEAAGEDTRLRQQQDDETPGTMPHILMFSSGELTPFAVYLGVEDGAWTYRISGDEIQPIRLEKAEHIAHAAY